MNWNELIVGAIIGAIFSIVFHKYWEIAKNKYLLRNLKNVLPILNSAEQNSITVIPSLAVLYEGRTIKSKRGYTHSSEMIALFELFRRFRKLPLEFRFQYNSHSQSIPNSTLALGLSRPQSGASDEWILKLKTETNIELIKNEGTCHFLKFNNQTFGCKHIDEGEGKSRVSSDFALIYRSTNGTNSVLRCGGGHMFGTQAAIEVAFSDQFIDRVKNSGKYGFAQIVKVAIKSDGLTIDGIDWKDLPFVSFGEPIDELRS